jgi:hypothetical protein
LGPPDGMDLGEEEEESQPWRRGSMDDGFGSREGQFVSIVQCFRQLPHQTPHSVRLTISVHALPPSPHDLACTKLSRWTPIANPRTLSLQVFAIAVCVEPHRLTAVTHGPHFVASPTPLVHRVHRIHRIALSAHEPLYSPPNLSPVFPPSVGQFCCSPCRAEAMTRSFPIAAVLLPHPAPSSTASARPPRPPGPQQ